MATFSDDFNRSDSGASAGWGANWTHYQDGVATNSGAEILSNQGRINSGFTLRTVAWNGGAVGADQFSQATMVTGSDDSGEYVAVRKTDGANFYAAGRLNGTTVRLSKYVAGVQTTLDTQTVSIVNGDVLRLEVSGTTLNFYVNAALQIGPITDSDLSSGQPGIRVLNNADWDDWSGGDLSSDDATITPTTGSLTLQGRAALANDFTAITLRGTLINEAGSPVADATGIACLVWYGSAPAGTPDESLSSLTTNANGSYSFALALGGLAFNDPVYRVIYSGDPPTRNHAGRRVPDYE